MIYVMKEKKYYSFKHFLDKSFSSYSLCHVKTLVLSLTQNL